MPVKHHLPDEWLIDYAAGALDEAGSAMVASHLSLCPTCRATQSQMEAAGAALLEGCEKLPVSDACRAKMMALLEEDQGLCNLPADQPASLCRVLPAPIRLFSRCGVDGLKFERLSSTLERMRLPAKGDTTLQIIRLKAGSTLPRHDHKGSEITLILAGSLRDGDKLYRRGDVCVCEKGQIHSPQIGEAEDCLCLMFTTAPLRPTRMIDRFLGRLAGF